MKINIESVLPEIQELEKYRYLGEGTPSGNTNPDSESSPSNENNETGSEEEDDDDEEEEEDLKPIAVDEQVLELRERLEASRREVDELKSTIMCKICLDNKADTLFLTCRHYCTCASCADRLKDCPICRKTVLGTVDVFWS